MSGPPPLALLCLAALGACTSGRERATDDCSASVQTFLSDCLNASTPPRDSIVDLAAVGAHLDGGILTAREQLLVGCSLSRLGNDTAPPLTIRTSRHLCGKDAVICAWDEGQTGEVTAFRCNGNRIARMRFLEEQEKAGVPLSLEACQACAW